MSDGPSTYALTLPPVGSTLSKDDPRFLRHVRDLYPVLDALFDAGEDVRSLTAHPGWTHLMALLEAETAMVDRHLDGASEPLSQAEYAMAHGRRGGLRGAVAAAEALVSHADTKLAEQRRIHEGAAEPALGR